MIVYRMRCNSPTRWNFDPALMIHLALGTGKVDRWQRQKIKHNNSVSIQFGFDFVGHSLYRHRNSWCITLNTKWEIDRAIGIASKAMACDSSPVISGHYTDIKGQNYAFPLVRHANFNDVFSTILPLTQGHWRSKSVWNQEIERKKARSMSLVYEGPSFNDLNLIQALTT